MQKMRSSKDSIINFLLFCALSDEANPENSIIQIAKNAFGPGIKVVKKSILHYEVLCIETNVHNWNLNSKVKIHIAQIGMGPQDSALNSAIIGAIAVISRDLRPDFIGMTGICAGRAGKVKKGDIIFCRDAWHYGNTKKYKNKSQYNILHDIKVFSLSQSLFSKISTAAKEFKSTHGKYLEEIFPKDHNVTNLTTVPPAYDHFKVHLGDIHTTNKVIEYDSSCSPFDELKKYKRNTIGLDMEATSIFQLAEQLSLRAFVCKSVQDYGQSEKKKDGTIIPKNDIYRNFAAKSSLLFAFFIIPTLISHKSELQIIFGLGAGDQKQDDVLNCSPEEEFKDIVRKISLDFQNSCISSWTKLEDAILQSNQNLRNNDLLDTVPTISDHVDIKNEAVFKGFCNSKSAAILKNIRQVRVCCSAIYPAALATFIRLKEEFLFELFLDLEWANSIDVISAINEDDEYEFIFTAEDPYAIAQSGKARSYRRVCPITKASQKVFMLRGQKVPKKSLVYVVPQSSGATQYRSLKSRLANPEIDQIGALELIDKANNLKTGELLPSWDPISYTLEQNPALVSIPDFNYTIYVSLFCNKKILQTKKGEKFVSAFKNSFIAKWNSSSNNPEACAETLLRQPSFIEYFRLGSLGSGHQ